MARRSPRIDDSSWLADGSAVLYLDDRQPSSRGSQFGCAAAYPANRDQASGSRLARPAAVMAGNKGKGKQTSLPVEQRGGEEGPQGLKGDIGGDGEAVEKKVSKEQWPDFSKKMTEMEVAYYKPIAEQDYEHLMHLYPGVPMRPGYLHPCLGFHFAVGLTRLHEDLEFFLLSLQDVVHN
jgi:hypothetical protein